MTPDKIEFKFVNDDSKDRQAILSLLKRSRSRATLTRFVKYYCKAYHNSKIRKLNIRISR